MPEYDAITPAQWVLFLWAALIVFSIMWWLFWHVGRGDTPIERDDAEPGEIISRAWLALLHWRPSHMSSEQPDETAESGMEPVCIPVSQYGMEASGMDAPPLATPDIEAENNGMPAATRDITSDEQIVLLAAMRGKDRKPRFSANAIHTLIGGDRNTVLAKVKEIRDRPDAPVFPLRSPEQLQLREQLQLDER